jgi:hypothetical protein
VRALTTHRVNEQNSHVEILGGAVPKGMVPNTYRVILKVEDPEAASITKVERIVQFQRGPISEGINGNVTDESLLAILSDRLEHMTDEGYAGARNAAVALRTVMDVFKRRGER